MPAHAPIFLNASNPTVNDDGVDTSGKGIFIVGHKWVNTATDETFTCNDNATAAADWKSTTAVPRNSWEFTGSRNANLNSPQDLRRSDGTPTNVVPYIIPIACELWAISASTETTAVGETWDAQVFKNGVSVASINLDNQTSNQSVLGAPVAFAAGDEVRLRCNRTSGIIDMPSMDAFFRET